jgi:hypothetical protein
MHRKMLFAPMQSWLVASAYGIQPRVESRQPTFFMFTVIIRQGQASQDTPTVVAVDVAVEVAEVVGQKLHPTGQSARTSTPSHIPSQTVSKSNSNDPHSFGSSSPLQLVMVVVVVVVPLVLVVLVVVVDTVVLVMAVCVVVAVVDVVAMQVLHVNGHWIITILNSSKASAL